MSAESLARENEALRKVLGDVLFYVQRPHLNEHCGCEDCEDVRRVKFAAEDLLNRRER